MVIDQCLDCIALVFAKRGVVASGECAKRVEKLVVGGRLGAHGTSVPLGYLRVAGNRRGNSGAEGVAEEGDRMRRSTGSRYARAIPSPTCTPGTKSS